MAMKKFDTITLKDIFGRTIEIKGTIISEKTHGYNLPSGAWLLYHIEELHSCNIYYLQKI